MVEGVRVSRPDPRRIFVFQENGVFPWLNVRENISFGLRARSKEEQNAIVARYVEMVGLNGFEDAYPRELSGGMRQRVEIARALAANPDIIYMDEPFGALDFLTRMKMRADLTRIWQAERKTILFVTHDIEEAVQLADRIFVFTKRPATLQKIVNVDLPRPRDLDSPNYLQQARRNFPPDGNEFAHRRIRHGELRAMFGFRQTPGRETRFPRRRRAKVGHDRPQLLLKAPSAHCSPGQERAAFFRQRRIVCRRQCLL